MMLSAVAGVTFGQASNPTKNSLTISLGADHHRLIDQAFTSSRLKFTGTSFSTALFYQRTTDVYAFETRVQGGTGKVATGDNTLTSRAGRIHLSVSYARSVVNYSLLNTQNIGYLGVQASSFNSAIYNEALLENVSVTFYNTLNVLLKQTTRLDQAKDLQLELVLPVLGWTKRSIYDGGANQELENDADNIGNLLFNNSRFSFVNPLSVPRINLTYVHRLTPKTDFTLKYFFSYLYDNDIEPIKSYQNGLLAGLKFNF